MENLEYTKTLQKWEIAFWRCNDLANLHFSETFLFFVLKLRHFEPSEMPSSQLIIYLEIFFFKAYSCDRKFPGHNGSLTFSMFFDFEKCDYFLLRRTKCRNNGPEKRLSALPEVRLWCRDVFPSCLAIFFSVWIFWNSSIFPFLEFCSFLFTIVEPNFYH